MSMNTQASGPDSLFSAERFLLGATVGWGPAMLLDGQFDKSASRTTSGSGLSLQRRDANLITRFIEA